MNYLDNDFWTNRYKNNQSGWDIGYPSPPLVNFLKTVRKEAKILIPGCGNAYEAEYAFKNGYKDIFVLDISELPLINFSKRVSGFPKSNLICGDFFEHAGKYDIILEQTFFCALPRNLRENYVEKCFRLLKDDGILAGLLFKIEFEKEGPPFGGTMEEYLELFSKRFKKVNLSPETNSIVPRKNTELFLKAKKI